jgi:hypothetical protein
MSWLRRILIVGAGALVALPALAVAAGEPAKPIAGEWMPYNQTQGENSASFTVGSGRGHVTSLQIAVAEGEINPGCPTGTVTVSGTLGLRLFQGGISGNRPFWAFGQLGRRKNGHNRYRLVFEAAPVKATLEGKPVHGAKLELEFGDEDREGVHVQTASGVFVFTSKCEASLGESDQPGG